MQQENPYQIFAYLGANGLEMIISNIVKKEHARQCKGRHG